MRTEWLGAIQWMYGGNTGGMPVENKGVKPEGERQ